MAGDRVVLWGHVRRVFRSRAGYWCVELVGGAYLDLPRTASRPACGAGDWIGASGTLEVEAEMGKHEIVLYAHRLYSEPTLALAIRTAGQA